LLLKSLEDADHHVRSNAALGLGHIQSESEIVVAALIESLQEDSHPWMRESAAEGLSRLGKSTHAAVPALLTALKDKNENAREAAAKALRAIDPEASSNAYRGGKP